MHFIIANGDSVLELDKEGELTLSLNHQCLTGAMSLSEFETIQKEVAELLEKKRKLFGVDK